MDAVPIDEIRYRDPLNAKYCKAVNCPSLHGNKCMEDHCIRKGNEKRALYYTKHDKLAVDDEPEK